MLRLENVSRRFATGVTALDAVTLTIPQGSMTVLLGPSGCGKSTLLRLIAGLDRPDSGQLVFERGPPAQGEIGMVFQDPVLMPWASALANTALPLRLRGAHPAPAASMLARVGLAGFEQARPAQLSGGMRMRVSLARALAAGPRLLLLDEPFAALDEFTRHGLQDLLRQLTEASGCTTVFVTHSLYEAAYLASRVVLLSPRPGRVAQIIDFAAPVPDRLHPEFAARAAALTQATQAVLA